MNGQPSARTLSITSVTAPSKWDAPVTEFNASMNAPIRALLSASRHALVYIDNMSLLVVLRQMSISLLSCSSFPVNRMYSWWSWQNLSKLITAKKAMDSTMAIGAKKLLDML